MALRDYSNGQNPDLARMIDHINEQEDERHRQEVEHLETVGKIGLAFAVGTALANLLQGRRSQ